MSALSGLTCTLAGTLFAARNGVGDPRWAPLSPFRQSPRSLELQRVYGKSWSFVARESEIPKLGSWAQRTMGEQSVMVARGEDGVIRTFLNSCRYRRIGITTGLRGDGVSDGFGHRGRAPWMHDDSIHLHPPGGCGSAGSVKEPTQRGIPGV